jgi:hypothetical protein
MHIVIYCDSLIHFVETLAWNLSYDGSRNVTVVTERDGASRGSEHGTSCARLVATPGVRLVDQESPAQASDLLLIVLRADRPMRNRTLEAWQQVAARHGILTYGRYPRRIRDVARELVRAWPYYLRASLIGVQTGPCEWNPYFHIRHRFYYRPYVHPQFFPCGLFHSDFMSILGAQPARRRYRLIFIGSLDRPDRALLEHLRQKLSQWNVALHDDPASPVDDQKANVLWITYDSGSRKRGVHPGEYLRLLANADFCFCPAGWSLRMWTHRTVEALCCGAIPIVPDPDDYNIGLADGINCLQVSPGGWPAVLERAIHMEPESVAAMRANVSALKNSELLPDRACRAQCTALGL